MAKSSNFKGRAGRHEAGRALSELLRVSAQEEGLKPDRHGFVPISHVLAVLRTRFEELTIDHIVEIVQKDAQQRFDLVGDLIRAKAGHRFEVEPIGDPVSPPEELYHGTCREAADRIREEGILKMGKAFVHLASTVQRARRIGVRKTKEPVILIIAASRASRAGVRFWQSGQVSPDGAIYLSDEVPAAYVSELRDSSDNGGAPDSPRGPRLGGAPI